MIFGGKKAFTLIELLIAVSIFSGIVVLALGAFARSANSSLKSAQIRERTEAARTLVDRISNDLQYVYLDENFTAGTQECATSGIQAKGLYFNSGCLFMLIKLPTETNLIAKKYSVTSSALELSETRDCTLNSGAITCPNGTYTVPSKISSDKFKLQDTVSLFLGINPYSAELNNTTPIVRVSVTVSEVGFAGNCSNEPSQCYTIKSSFVPGG